MQTTNNSSDNFQIDKLLLNGVDLRNEYLGLAIYENIFVNTTTVSIDILEIYGFLETQDFEEGTKLEISYFTKYAPLIPEMPSYVEEFDLYKIERIRMVGQGKRIYRMHFISKEAHTDHQKLISRPYREKSSTEMVESLFSFLEPHKPLDIEPSEDRSPLFVVPNMKPFTAINKVCRSAFKAGMNDYVFFQSKDAFVCKPIRTLMDQGPVLDYIMEQTSLEWEHDKKIEHRNIIDYYIDRSSWNSLENIDSGYYGSKQFTRNILTKKHDFTEYSGKETAFSGPDNLHINASDNYHNRQKIREYYQERLGLISEVNEKRLILTVPGNTNLTVGQTVNVKIPTTRERSITDQQVAREDDPTLSGKYLISKLKHEISQVEVKFIVEVIKVPE